MPSSVAASALAAAAAVGIVLTWCQLAALWRHLRAPRPTPTRHPPISILKPLCGLDDQLAANLRSFAALTYPSYEVVLGVCSQADPAYAIACDTVRRWPRRFRIAVQDGAPGLNPKVNQLMTLARRARHDILVISDSNARVERDYLEEIAAALEDPSVGLVTHPLVGDGEARRGARLGAIADNLHLTGVITPSIVAAKLLCGKDYVVGKSMAMRRADVDALGGFASVKDVLAEDFVLGRAVVERLRKRVVLAHSPVTCVSERRRLGGFVRRYARWNVMQRQCAGLPAYVALLLENPAVLALLVAAIARTPITITLACAAGASRMATDVLAGRLLRGRGFSPRALLFGSVKDLLCAGAWAYGLVSRTIEWRSHRLTVLCGSRLRVTAKPAHRLPAVKPAAAA
jgi:ceramide glucosyltransferase